MYTIYIIFRLGCFELRSLLIIKYVSVNLVLLVITKVIISIIIIITIVVNINVYILYTIIDQHLYTRTEPRKTIVRLN